MMIGPEQVWDYRFTSIDMPIVRLGRRLSVIAEMHGWKIEAWEEDGLGEVFGVLVRLPSGRTIALLEYRHLIEHFHERGPTAYIDASELANCGVGPLLEEILTGFRLSRQDADWVTPAISQNLAWNYVKQGACDDAQPPYAGQAGSYFHGIWLNAKDDEPVEYYDELDADRYSIRCIRKYHDGRLMAHSYASKNWRDVMPEGPIPPLAEINQNPEFSAKEISKSDFERVWIQASRSMLTS